MKTTKKDFRLFKKECRKWIEFFGLKQYECRYFHDKCDGRAEFYTDITGGLFSVTLNTEFNNCKITKREIKMVASHEIVEGLLFANAISLCFERGYDSNEVDNAFHPIVRTLENTVFK